APGARRRSACQNGSKTSHCTRLLTPSTWTADDDAAAGPPEPATGFEPVTPTLPRLCATPAPRGPDFVAHRLQSPIDNIEPPFYTASGHLLGRATRLGG